VSRVIFSRKHFIVVTPASLFRCSGEIFSILARRALATGLLHAGISGSDSASPNNDADNNSLNRVLSEKLLMTTPKRRGNLLEITSLRS